MVENLCVIFCPYYKPLKKDELACMGFVVVERLLKNGKKILFDKPEKKLDAVTQEILIQNMCIACPFYENDCDFVEQKQGALPCGGLILLGHLLEKNIISIDDLKNII